eukprot:GHVU01189068.1.p1 GENE.GHVU01189068.1~~GHVU01189068.1.p1  ORF type:complete len:289 (-),score=37.88 GHVU01189068.1:812-1678(-)
MVMRGGGNSVAVPYLHREDVDSIIGAIHYSRQGAADATAPTPEPVSVVLDFEVPPAAVTTAPPRERPPAEQTQEELAPPRWQNLPTVTVYQYDSRKTDKLKETQWEMRGVLNDSVEAATLKASLKSKFKGNKTLFLWNTRGDTTTWEPLKFPMMKAYAKVDDHSRILAIGDKVSGRCRRCQAERSDEHAGPALWGGCRVVYYYYFNYYYYYYYYCLHHQEEIVLWTPKRGLEQKRLLKGSALTDGEVLSGSLKTATPSAIISAMALAHGPSITHSLTRSRSQSVSLSV